MAGVVAAVTAAVLLPMGVASAETETIEDEIGDVWQNFYDIPTGEATYEPVGSPPNTDLSKLTVTHDRKRLTVRATFVDLVVDDEHKTGIQAFIRLDNGDGALLAFHINDDWKHPWVGVRSVPLVTPGKSRNVRCPDLAADIDFRRDTMTATVPTTCLGKPRWVQVHGLASAGSEDEDGQAATSYQDSPHTDGYQSYWYTATTDCFTECEGWTAKLRRTR